LALSTWLANRKTLNGRYRRPDFDEPEVSSKQRKVRSHQQRVYGSTVTVVGLSMAI